MLRIQLSQRTEGGCSYVDFIGHRDTFFQLKRSVAQCITDPLLMLQLTLFKPRAAVTEAIAVARECACDRNY